MHQPSPTKANLQYSNHGKNRVRVAKVHRHQDGTHTIAEYSVQVELEGGTDRAFTHGDNRKVVATDTCKNHVYMLAKSHPCTSPEHFAIALSRRFLDEYSFTTAVHVSVIEKPWARTADEDGSLHKHGFQLTNQGTRKCVLRRSRTFGSSSNIVLHSCLTDLSVLKTTQSGWEDFVDDRYTTLPGTNERLLATTVNAKWSYPMRTEDALSLDFNSIHSHVKKNLLKEFFGPADRGHYSKGVQETLYKMGSAVVNNVEQVETITLSLPNIHFLPCNLPVYKKNGIRFEDDVYIPTDEPHGIISATISRSMPSKL